MAPKRLSREQIELVRERRCLYDVRDPDHADSTIVANAWMAITEKMGLKDGGEFHGPPVSALGVWMEFQNQGHLLDRLEISVKTDAKFFTRKSQCWEKSMAGLAKGKSMPVRPRRRPRPRQSRGNTA